MTQLPLWRYCTPPHDFHFVQGSAPSHVYFIHKLCLRLICIMLHLLTSVSSVVYDSEEEVVGCSDVCINAGHCQCSKCRYLKKNLIQRMAHLKTFLKLQQLLKVHGEVHSLSLGQADEWGRSAGRHSWAGREKLPVSLLFI